MGKIKTRETVRDIKKLDRAAIVGERMKQAYIRTKENTANLTDDRQRSPDEYAEDQVLQTAENLSRDTVHLAGSGVTTAAERGRMAYQRSQAKKAAEKAQHTAGPSYSHYGEYSGLPFAGNTNADMPTQAVSLPRYNSPYPSPPRASTPTTRVHESTYSSNPTRAMEQGRELAKKQAAEKAITIRQRKNTSSAISGHTDAPAYPAIKQRSAAVTPSSKTALSPRVKSVETSKRTIKTAKTTSRTTIKTASAAAKTAQRNAAITAKAAQASAVRAQAAAKAAVITAKTLGKAAISALKVLLEAGKSLVAALAASGSVVALVVVVICLIGLLVGSCFGIFFSGEDTGNGWNMGMVVQEINSEYEAEIESIKESVSHDSVEQSGSPAEWKDVLAIYAVKTTTDRENGQEVASITDVKKDLLRDVFWDMTEIDYHTETSGDEDSRTTTLYITISSKTAAEMADEYDFNEDQRTQLDELLAEENNILWDSVLNSIATGGDGGGGTFVPGGSGSYLWPLSGYRYISSPFGWRICPFHGREYHSGVDIPAPGGTSIMATFSGTVITSMYGSSYGNYVVISHTNGGRSVYAHMSARLVSVGQTVSQGQVIGRVGTTGDSTGNHLHFELWTGNSSATRVDPAANCS